MAFLLYDAVIETVKYPHPLQHLWMRGASAISLTAAMIDDVILKLLLFFTVLPLFAGDWYLFTSFRKNGETGVYFALSQDGRKWTSLNHDQPWIAPAHEGMLMRDPYLGRADDGVWHLLWTWGWTRDASGHLKIGHSSSRDLIQWTPQREIDVLDSEPTARNAWAPEAVWDAERKEWIVFWASTIPGRFPDTESSGDSGYNHRISSSNTHDWETFTPARLWFDPGFNCIDSTVVRTNPHRWIMVFKDERKVPLQKRLRMAFADSPRGPWKDVSEPFTRDWVEGPSVAHIGAEWWIYFDHYTKPQKYGAVRTKDWKKFEDISDRVELPEGQRHGTVVKISEAEAKKLNDKQ